MLEELGCAYTFFGSERKTINNISPLHIGTSNDLSFCSSDDYESIKSILRSESGIILCKRGLERLLDYPTDKDDSEQKVLVFVDNPRLVFIKIAKLIKNSESKRKGLSNHAVISDSAKIGRDCYIGDFAVIGDESVIGDNTVISSRAVLKNCTIGNNCLVQSGSIIGEDGFAFERNEEDAKLEKFPHYGKVILKDDVEIFANCSIARGSISDTIIEQGTKIDALCHVAHNVHIGKNTQFAAGVVVGGSTTIGDNCWLGLNSTIKHKLKIGDNVIVGSGSSVIHDVEAKDIVACCPAKSIRYKTNITEDKLFLMAAQERNSKSKI